MVKKIEYNPFKLFGSWAGLFSGFFIEIVTNRDCFMVYENIIEGGTVLKTICFFVGFQKTWGDVFLPAFLYFLIFFIFGYAIHLLFRRIIYKLLEMKQ